MIDKIIRLGKDTAIYGTSTILGRLLNFLLVPFYTNVLLPSEYGITAYVYSLIAFLNVVYNYGMESAYFKYSSTLEIGDRKQNFNTPFLSIIISSSFFSAIILLLSKPIGGLIALPEDFSRIIIYSAIILFLDAIVIIPFASLRQTGKAKKFALIKFLNILINVSLNIILLVKFKLGVEGIFISGLAASAMTVVILLSDIFKNFRFNFSAKLFKELLKFGLPSLPAGLAAMMLQVIDRPILRYLTDDSSVGIYQANYRLGIFMMLVVSMFDYAWKPFFFSTAKEQNAKDIFARITTYFLLGMATVFILITLLIENIVKFQIYGKFIIHPDYWSGLNIVPIILLAYLFNGLSLTFSAGIYIQKKTSYLPFITLIAAIANVVFNFLLIPMLGIIGAAFATLISYVVMAVTMYYYSQKFYRIEY
ncbi:MAG: oligosaccharide flippase family protein, partial [Bacteroidetes bacterium]|nr:oligosaccharide flippase family protein [Bacteroidota bacterium]MBU1422401.1 oligosaccharide flippase family protein [Bacteroidota bacterium]